MNDLKEFLDKEIKTLKFYKEDIISRINKEGDDN
jgi:hypothetical protein